MVISAPQLISCSARVEESVVIGVGTNTFIFAVKNHKGSPLRELEVFSFDDIQKSGPFFFNVTPTRVEILDQVFRFVSAVVLTTDAEIGAGANPIIRFYWNQIAGRSTGQNPILYMDYDVVDNTISSTVKQVSFDGLDPFIMDARTQKQPNRLYMLHITETGAQSLKISRDLGQTWSQGCTCCDRVKYIEGVIQDPAGLREQIRSMQMVSDDPTFNPVGDVCISNITTTPISIPLIQRTYPFVGQRRPKKIDSDGRDASRFRAITPLVIRTPGTREVC